MNRKKQIKVIPSKKILSDKGTVWESELWSAGWNKLSDEDKQGIVQSVRPYDKTHLLQVYWPALKLITFDIFLDEIYRVGE